MNQKSESTISAQVGPPGRVGISSTLRDVRVFLCYRRNDGAWYAEWLNEHLSGAEFTDSGGSRCRIRTYYDKIAPGVADWKSLHFPSLQASQALVLVCTPGIAKDLSKRGHPDWVYEELRWWIRNRLTSPIVIDATGEGDRWLPEIIVQKWPNLNRIDVDKRQAEAAVTTGDAGFADRVRERIIGAIRQSEKATVFEDLERYKRLTRHLRLALICSLVLLVGIITGLVGWINQSYVREQWNWYTKMRPYRVANFDGYALEPDNERALALMPGQPFRECAKDCPAMVVVRAGDFMLGSPTTENGGDNEKDSNRRHHPVTIARPFAASKFEVTFADWDACVSVGGCPRESRALDDGWGRGTRPVIYVSWDDAQQYVAWLSRMTGKPYRLLSEAEWEYAARAGSTTAYSWGDEIGKNNAVCRGCGSDWDGRQTAPVGSFAPNAFGLHDMRGNVSEWVEDCYHENYDETPNDGSAWTTPDCGSHLVRGGSWLNQPRFLRSANRNWDAAGNRSYDSGFRVARTLLPP
jgi:formylglycine-generating enzyme required for sulfatase activity